MKRFNILFFSSGRSDYDLIKPVIEEFKKEYLNNIPIEEIYKEEFIGIDNNRKYMKWFKFPK